MLSRIRDHGPHVRGSIRAYDRPAGSSIWRPVLEAENVILNQWYLDLYSMLMPSPPGGLSLAFMNLALGYGVSPSFSRTDTGLALPWSTTVATLSVASGVTVGTTTLNVSALPMKLPDTHTITIGTTGTPQVLTVNGDAAIGATSIAVQPFTPNHSWPIGTPIIFSDTAIHIPQHCANVIGTPDPTDPPSVTASFYLSSAANTGAIRFTEAALYYNSDTKAGSHVSFTYLKNSNTDLRIDYTLTRETS